ncbi:MAG: ATP-binding protein, partial [Myxococcota bacterium]
MTSSPPPALEGLPRRPRRGAVARRLLYSFLAVMLAFAVTVGWGVVAQRRTARDSELLRSGYLPLVLSLEAALENQNLVSAQLKEITEAKNPADARQWIETARKLRPRIYEDIRKAAQRGVVPATDPHAQQVGRTIVASSEQVESFLSEDWGMLAKLFEALERGESERARDLRNGVLAHEIAGARRVRALKEQVESEMDRLIFAARERERRALHSLLALAALTLMVGVGMTLYARRVLRPLAAVTSRAHAVAAGDMTPQPVVEARDEIGELAATFESMVAAIAKANDARLQAERLAAVGRMAAHVTHEIRNPLSSIGLNLELLEEEIAMSDVSSEPRQLLQAIRREVDHLSALSEEYLRLARPPKPRLEPETLPEIIQELASFVRPELQRAGVELVLDFPDDPADVSVDEQQIRQALGNLMRNAREAMGKGGTLAIRLRELDASTTEVIVEDTGPGIPEEIRKNVFDPFFTTKNRGTGLGLAITRQVIESHGGSIVCEAVEPHGTRFRIRLRRA